MAKKSEPKSNKASRQAGAKKPQKAAHDKVPQQAENIEHTIRRVVRERQRYRADKYGLYL